MPDTTCGYVQLSFSFITSHSSMVQEKRQNLTGSAISFLLLGVVGGFGPDLCAKGLLATHSLGQLVFLRSLIGGAVAGYLIRDEVPDRWVVLGATVIIASGLFVVYREIGEAISGKHLRTFTASSAAALKRGLTR